MLRAMTEQEHQERMEAIHGKGKKEYTCKRCKNKFRDYPISPRDDLFQICRICLNPEE